MSFNGRRAGRSHWRVSVLQTPESPRSSCSMRPSCGKPAPRIGPPWETGLGRICSDGLFAAANTNKYTSGDAARVAAFGQLFYAACIPDYFLRSSSNRTRIRAISGSECRHGQP